MKEIGIGILGFGTVGAGVVEGLQRNGDLIAQRTGVRLRVVKIADLDLKTDRGVRVDPSILTVDGRSVIDDPAVDIIVELIGGTTVARAFMLQALAQRKPVVTANKALLAECGREICGAAEEHDTDLYFEASVAGGIPVIRALREGLSANHIHGIYGVLNGTCNYILTRMEEDEVPFAEVLKEAQAAGYAEAEPSLDIDGIDTAHKAVILASMAYGAHFALEDIHVEGIRAIDPLDIVYAKELGYKIKLLAIIKEAGAEVDVRVHPALIPEGHIVASVNGVFNAVMIHGDRVGDTFYYGKGAGRDPTASAVIGDIVEVARNMLLGIRRRVPAFVDGGVARSVRPLGDIESRYYVRLMLRDLPGALSEVSSILGAFAISIASVIQKEARTGEDVPVVMATEKVGEHNVDQAIAAIQRHDFVRSDPVKLRIEDV